MTTGTVISNDFDSLIAKVITVGDDRAEAIALETDALLLKACQAVEAFAQMTAVIEMDRSGMAAAFATGAGHRRHGQGDRRLEHGDQPLAPQEPDGEHPDADRPAPARGQALRGNDGAGFGFGRCISGLVR